MINTFIRRVHLLLLWTFSANTVLAQDPDEAMAICIVVPAGFGRRDQSHRGPPMGLPAADLLCCGEVGALGGHGDSPSL